MNLPCRLLREIAFACTTLAATCAQAQWATVNTVSNPPGAFTITCTDFPIPSAEQTCAVTPPPSAPGATVQGNCGGSVRQPDDPAQPNTWLYLVGPRPFNPPTATCTLTVTAPATAGSATAIPTLSEWGLIVMSLLAAGLGLVAVHRRNGI